MKLRTNSICALVASALLASTTCNLNDHQEAAVAPSRVTSAAEVSEVYDYFHISQSCVETFLQFHYKISESI